MENYWQLCPKCNGDGNLSRYSSPQLSTGASLTCDVCDGQKIISTVTGRPPSGVLYLKNEPQKTETT